MAVTSGAQEGVPRDRVVAVVARLEDGREQWGSGYAIGSRLVLTAEHCTRDKLAGGHSRAIRVVRASDGATCGVSNVVASAPLDVAVLELADDAPWPASLGPPDCARVDRSRSGVLLNCEAVGYPLFQRDPEKRTRDTAEFHGVIYQTDEAESGRILAREPLIHPGPIAPGNEREAPSPWGGLSGALLFHKRRAIGIVVEHHPRQGASALRAVGFDTVARMATTEEKAKSIAKALRLPKEGDLAWATPDDAEAEVLSRVQAIAGAVLPPDEVKVLLAYLDDLLERYDQLPAWFPRRLRTTFGGAAELDQRVRLIATRAEGDGRPGRGRGPREDRVQITTWEHLIEAPKKVILLEGDAGVGKSWSLRRYTVRLAHAMRERLKASPANQASLVPILVRLEDVASAARLSAFLDAAAPAWPSSDRNALIDSFARLCQRPRGVVLLVDGVDEASEEQRRDLAKALASGSELVRGATAGSVQVILASRRGRLRPTESTLGAELLPFTDDQRDQFVRGWVHDDERAQKVISQVRSAGRLGAGARNPLLLALTCLAAEASDPTTPPIPTEADILRSAIDALATDWHRDRVAAYVPSSQQRQVARDAIALVERTASLAFGPHGGFRQRVAAADVEAEERPAVIDHAVGTGLLTRVDDESYELVHRAVAEYLAATHHAKAGSWPVALMRVWESVEHHRVAEFLPHCLAQVSPDQLTSWAELVQKLIEGGDPGLALLLVAGASLRHVRKDLRPPKIVLLLENELPLHVLLGDARAIDVTAAVAPGITRDLISDTRIRTHIRRDLALAAARGGDEVGLRHLEQHAASHEQFEAWNGALQFAEGYPPLSRHRALYSVVPLPEARVAIAASLIRRGDDSAFTLMWDAVRESELSTSDGNAIRAEMRAFGLAVLAEAGDRDAVDALVAAFRADPSLGASDPVAAVIADQVRASDAVGLLLSGSFHNWESKAIIDGLARRNEYEAVKMLAREEALDPWVRVVALERLAEAGVADAADNLARAGEAGDSDPETRLAAGEALLRLGDNRGSDILMDLAGETRWSRAFIALEAIAGDVNDDFLTRIAKSEADYSTTTVAFKELARRGNAWGLAELKRRADPDVSHRRQARASARALVEVGCGADGLVALALDSSFDDYERRDFVDDLLRLGSAIEITSWLERFRSMPAMLRPPLDFGLRLAGVQPRPGLSNERSRALIGWSICSSELPIAYALQASQGYVGPGEEESLAAFVLEAYPGAKEAVDSYRERSRTLDAHLRDAGEHESHRWGQIR